MIGDSYKRTKQWAEKAEAGDEIIVFRSSPFGSERATARVHARVERVTKLRIYLVNRETGEEVPRGSWMKRDGNFHEVNGFRAYVYDDPKVAELTILYHTYVRKQSLRRFSDRLSEWNQKATDEQRQEMLGYLQDALRFVVEDVK